MTNATRRLLQDSSQAWLKGFAQVAFLDRPVHGLLVLVAIGVVAPWSAAAAAFGGTLAILLGKSFFGQSEPEWKEGFGAYDCILLGIAWGGAFAIGLHMVFLLSMAVLACLALRGPVVRWFNAMGLPPLAVPGLISTWLSVSVFSAFGSDFWLAPPDNPFGRSGAAIAIIVVALGLFLKHPRAAAGTALAATATAILYFAVEGDPFSIRGAGLWAFTVAPAIFAPPAVFLDGFRSGWRAGVTAAMLSSATWLLWRHLPVLDQVPPLMGPLFIGIWSAILLTLGKDRKLCLDPGVQRTARLMMEAQTRGATLALTGAGLSTASGIPDYTAGHWLDPGIPVSRYSYGAFLADPESRSLYWDACARFRDVATNAKPNPGHFALAELEASGCIGATITQNVDGLHQAAGSRQVEELHGNISKVRCLACDHVSEWPATGSWRYASPCCESCGGLLKPAVIAFGESIRLATWHNADEKVGQCAALLVVGSQLAVSSAGALLATTRARRVPCIFVTLGQMAVPILPSDIVLPLRTELALPALARLIGTAKPGQALQ